MKHTAGRELSTKTRTPAHIRKGLIRLLKAYHYAIELDHDIWDFAVEISSLLADGMSTNDFRWLVGKGFVEHGREISHDGLHREFAQSGRFTFSEKTCFVLTEEGCRVAAELERAAEPDVRHDDLADLLSSFLWSNGQAAGGSTPAYRNGSRPVDTGTVARGNQGSAILDDSAVPVWDADRHELKLGNKLVKVFKLPSPNQEAILMAFDEEGWPPRIDDPLTPAPEMDPKRRLHDTIKSLNRNQKNRLIRFMGDGTGEGVLWESVSPRRKRRR